MRLLNRIMGTIGDDDLDVAQTRKSRYTHLQRLFITAMSIAIILPLAITASLGLYQYRSLMEREARDQLHTDALAAKQALEFHISESLSTMVITAGTYGQGQLFDQTTLEDLFTRLRSEYWWVTDLSIYDFQGIQRAYAGPYPFLGQDYSSQGWFQAANTRSKYISDVFTGYRGAPHFVITVSRGVPGTQEFWILRASVNAEHLESYIDTINTNAATDMFLVTRDRLLRTMSSNNGAVGEKYEMVVTPLPGVITMGEKEIDGSPVLVAAADLEDMPWMLVLEERGFAQGENWNDFRSQFIVIGIATALAGFLLVLRVSRSMIRQIRKADDRRDKVLDEAQHTAKLASVGRLAAGVAHEVNNPLAIINEKVGLINDLADASKDFPNRDRFLALSDEAADAVRRCKDITHRLLGFARRMEVRKEDLKINEVIRDVVSFVEREAMFRNIEIVLDLEEGVSVIESDRGQLQQIFLNIVNNALDAIESDGKVTISTRGESQFVVTTITDTGPGIPAKIRNNIFEPFFTTKVPGEGSGGTGLGLSITYGLVKKLCGRIEIKSRPGEGATFIITFPKKCELEE
ncbi:MAG: sensor histidine kinase [Thermoleophilia bacterium]